MLSAVSRAILIGCLLFSALSANAQRGAITLPRNLAQITDQAADIVRGTISYVHVEPHPQFKHLHSVVVTIAVSKTFKGTATETATFRQFLWDPRDLRDAAGYRRGQQVILFLNKVTDIGFSSPVGLDQGRFVLERAPDGTVIAKNGQSNTTLMAGVAQSKAAKAMSPRARAAIANTATSGAEIPADVLEETVRALVTAGGQK